MRLYRNAVILLVVLGLLVGAYAVLKDKKKSPAPAPSDPVQTSTVKILDLDTQKMTGITIKGKEGQFVFANKDSKWSLVVPAGLNADTSVIDGIAYSLSTLSAEKVVDENAADVGKFGFNSPSEIEITLSEGPGRTIEVGDKTPTKEGYYVKEKGSSKVYTVSNSTMDKLLIKKNDLKSKSVFPFKPEELISISMEKEGSAVYKAKKLAENQWTLTYPVDAKMDTDAVNLTVQLLNNLKVVNFIDEKASDLDKYGLKNPAYGIQVETSGAKTKVLIGVEKERGAEIFAKLENSSEVFTLNPQNLNFLDKPVKDLIDQYAYLVDITDLNRIEVEMDGTKTVSEIQTDKVDRDKDVFIVNGKDVSALKDSTGNSYFRLYFQSLIGVTMDNLELGAVPSGKPEITMTYFLKTEPGTMKVEYVLKNNNTYYVMKNGKYSGLTVDKKKFDAAQGPREAYKALMEAMNK